MKNKTLKTGVRMMIVMSVLFIATGIVAAQTADSADNASTEAAMKMIGAGLALGLTGIGTGMSQGQIGAGIQQNCSRSKLRRSPSQTRSDLASRHDQTSPNNAFI